MSITGISTIDNAPHDVNDWLKQLRARLDWTENGRAYLLMRTVLHAVRDWLTVDEAAQLAAQMPILVRGIYYEGWDPSRTPVHPRSKSDFVARVDHAFTKEPLEDTEKAITAVFGLLEATISAGEIADVKHAMRANIQELWP
ncbi:MULTISPECIES: DUF2267 domain-containing protein [unclassified Roseitalea]|uniref:DUF2267 domain-containing protein n=1 Tax=unclassified Roseitalea TaxID=2639107 RepID=UPI00273E3792|nr:MULTISPECIES: DUF2267 domain-containing protein [unclassified Roseitalea]